MKHGDKVEIVNYGSIYWSINGGVGLKLIEKREGVNGDMTLYLYDKSPHLVGKKGIIENRKANDYGIRFEDGSYIAWFHKDQLKLI